MPRRRRVIVAGGCYHVINRGNNRSTVFLDHRDYAAFFDLLIAVRRVVGLEMLAACLMPNHFHFVVRTAGGGDVSRWMHRLLTTHTHRHHARYNSVGRVWQGRYKAFPIEQDGHLLTVMRYVERNALRAGLVERAQDWEWGSLAWRFGSSFDGPIASPPVALPSNWVEFVNASQTAEELEAIRASVNRQSPYGSEDWSSATQPGLAYEGSGRPPGRPRKSGTAAPVG